MHLLLNNVKEIQFQLCVRNNKNRSIKSMQKYFAYFIEKSYIVYFEDISEKLQFFRAFFGSFLFNYYISTTKLHYRINSI